MAAVNTTHSFRWWSQRALFDCYDMHNELYSYVFLPFPASLCKSVRICSPRRSNLIDEIHQSQTGELCCQLLGFNATNQEAAVSSSSSWVTLVVVVVVVVVMSSSTRRDFRRRPQQASRLWSDGGLFVCLCSCRQPIESDSLFALVRATFLFVSTTCKEKKDNIRLQLTLSGCRLSLPRTTRE